MTDHREPDLGEPRRSSSARSAMLVIVLALTIATFLNAPGLHKSAYNRSDGWQRDVALALTEPVADVSRALRLDEPRNILKAAIGRDDDDDIDTSVALEADVSARAIASTSSTPARPGSSRRRGLQDARASTAGAQSVDSAPGRPSFTPRDKLRLWVAGDSLVITPGYAILRALGKRPETSGLGVEGRVATGLTRPDVFNWFSEIRSRVQRIKPDVVVLGFGGNDDKAFMTGTPAQVSIRRFGDAAWRREYRRRVGGLLDMVNRAGAHAIWIGLPQTASKAQTQRFRVVNAAAAAEVRERAATATYIDTFRLFAQPGGEYRSSIEMPNGRLLDVRAPDGVHFARAGGDLIAREVVKSLHRRFDLSSNERTG